MNIQDFCATDSKRLEKPFSDEKYTYASNGHMIIRVSRIAEFSDSIPFESHKDLVFSDNGSGFSDIPAYAAPDKVKCSICKGLKFASECPECLGDGYVELEKDFSQYECECDTCKGNGFVSGGEEVCGNCHGTGETYKDRWAGVDINDYYLGVALLEKVKDLPGIKLANKAYRSQVYFQFDGGDGILMTMLRD